MELTRPFAENGDRQDFPVDTQGDGTMSLQQGFGSFYGLPPEEGGLFIDRMKFNQLMYLVSKGVIDNKTAIEALESEYGSLLTSTPKLLTENLEWTVGSGGDYEDLQTALNEVAKISFTNNVYLTIKLLNNLNLNNEIIVLRNVCNPNLSMDFNGFQIIWSNNTEGYVLLENSIINNINKLNLKNGSLRVFKSNTFLNTSVDIDSSNKGDCILCWKGSNLQIQENININLKPQSNRSGLYSNFGSILNLFRCNVNQTQGTVLNAYGGGIICAQASNITGGATATSQLPNHVTASGIILK